MHTITLSPLQHSQQENIGIYFSDILQLNNAVKKIDGCKWSKTFKCWYTPLSKENYLMIDNAFKGLGTIENARLKKYLTDKKLNKANAQPADKKLPGFVTNRFAGYNKQPVTKAAAIGYNALIYPVNAHVLPNMKQQLTLKAYSSSTIKTYLNEMGQLLQTIGKANADDLTPLLLKRYLVYCFDKLRLTENTLHSRINAMKFYYEQVLGRDKFFWEIPRPKKPLLLPNVLGEREITNLFNALSNVKHKAILFTAYSAGLRVSEAVSLKLKDIDSDRMQIRIQAAKGKKDRAVGLSPVLLDILRNYITKATPRPMEYLFESEVRGEAYSSRSAQKIFQRAKEKAGIRKDVSFHSLRHSFATHLLEKGIDIRFIKDILGHFDIRTTERYTHVRKDKLINITSPLDDLWLKGDIL